MTTSKDFSPPYNWCDSRCNCCPLEDCSVRLDMDRSAWAHEMRGEDPDDPEAFCKDVGKALERAMDMLTEIATEEGIDLDSPLEPPRIVSLEGKRLSNAGHRCFTEAVHALRTPAMQGAEPEALSAASEVLRLTSVLKMKTARLTSYVEGPSDDVWEFDGIPNLLLLEATVRAANEPLEILHAAVPTAHWRRVRDAVLTLGCLVEVLLAEQTEARSALEALVKERRAPSPFC